jgi:hypothetical protein
MQTFRIPRQRTSTGVRFPGRTNEPFEILRIIRVMDAFIGVPGLAGEGRPINDWADDSGEKVGAKMVRGDGTEV